jgi:hypothetical protein
MAASPGTTKRTIAVTELLLVSPAALFMTALFVRNWQPLTYEPARSAQRIVMWYAARPWTLWVLLRALPFAVLVIGCTALAHDWHDDAGLRETARRTFADVRTHFATVLVALATLAAAGILAIVALHALTD